MEITITITAGNDVEGQILKSPLVSALMPGMADAQAVHYLRQQMENHLVLLHAMRTNQNLGQSAAYVAQQTVETH